VGDRTGIEWTEATWNPATGCTKVSPGCDHCYAETIAHRFAGTKAYPDGFAPTLRPELLDQPLRWTRPRRIFVCSMADLFHDQVPDEYIAEVFAVMATAGQHTFQVLTKRHARMRSLLSSWDFVNMVAKAANVRTGRTSPPHALPGWPLPNVWVGVSAENQRWADIRIPALLDTPAAVRWVSAEPLLGPLVLHPYWTAGKPEWGPEYPEPTSPTGVLVRDLVKGPRLDWVVAGGESGPGARPMHPDWPERLRDDCAAAGVPFLFKQWGEWTPMAPLRDGVFDFTGSYSLANDGTLYEPGALAYPDGPRWGEALRADHGRAHLTSMYRLGKKAAGRELDGQLHDGYPAEVSRG